MKCTHHGCTEHIDGMTGYMEIANLMDHYEQAHGIRIDASQALVLREKAEFVEDNIEKDMMP